MTSAAAHFVGFAGGFRVAQLVAHHQLPQAQAGQGPAREVDLRGLVGVHFPDHEIDQPPHGFDGSRLDGIRQHRLGVRDKNKIKSEPQECVSPLS